MGEEEVIFERESESELCERVATKMDTPDRKPITTPISKFEDSPVFNYINSLSPIKPVKPTHISQTLNSLSFASLPSIFTSPHLSSLKQSRFLRRHHFSDPSKPECSSEDVNMVGRKEEIIDIVNNSAENQRSFAQGSSSGASAEPPYESSLAIGPSGTLSYECVIADCNTTTHCSMETKYLSELNGSSSSLVPFVQYESEKGSFGSDLHIEGIRPINENKEAAGRDWESLISDATYLSIFDSPNNTEPLNGPIQRSPEPGTQFCNSLSNGMQSGEAVEAVDLSEQPERDNTSSQHGEGSDKKQIADSQDILVSLSDCMAEYPSEKVEDELTSNMHRGMRRRCLVFEMVGASRKYLDDGSNCSSSMLSQSLNSIASNEKHLAPIKAGNDIQRCILPGIGLHLNTLAATSADHKVVQHDAFASRGQPISAPHSAAYFNTLNNQEIPNNYLVVTSLESDMHPNEGGAPMAEDASQASGDMVNEMLNHSSPKKKRRRLENGGESEACKRCNCKKSKCLKLYCECFAAGVYCVEPCSCRDCFNKPIHEDTVLATRKQIESRNPLAFAPKVIRSSDSVTEIGEESRKTPASARHKRGCNCKKSGCLKKYCECYQGGVGCSINCRCEGCKNAFGRKDGSSSIATETEEEEEAEESERSVVDRSLQKIVIQNETEHSTDSPLPATPSPFGRQLIPLPFSSKSTKSPRSSFLAVGSTSRLYANHRFGRQNLLPPQAKFEKQHFQIAREDEMPEILQRNCSPGSGVKSASPNSKRVSPPHCDVGMSPGRRSSRKLILRSIPSFPSLTPKH